MKCRGLNVVITGSAIRLGKVMALTLARKGANVVIHYNNSEREAWQTRDEVESYGVEAILVKANMGDMDDVKKMSDFILRKWGYVDVLINNAAMFSPTRFLDSGEQDFDKFMNVNLKAPYMLSRWLSPSMIERKQGKIINIADVAGYRPWGNYLPYGISKAGIIALTRGLAKALAPYVMVNAIAPGTVALAEEADFELERMLIEKTPLKRIGSPMDIANTALYLIEGTDFVNGEIIAVDGGRSLM